MWPHQQYRDVPDIVQHSERHMMHHAVGSSMSSQSQEAMAIPAHHQQLMHNNQQQFSQQHQRHNSSMTLNVSSISRASRNMAEKQRRGNFNQNIASMAACVPSVMANSRRLDKISILRLAAAYLRTQYTLGPGTPKFLPRQFSNFDLEQYVVDILIGSDGFLIVITVTGKIVYISPQIEQQLGHAQLDLLGQSLFNYIYPEDRDELTRNLTMEETTSQLKITETGSDENSNASEGSTRNNDSQSGEQRRSFNLRMSRRTVSRREPTQYEYLHISGLLRPAEACRNSTGTKTRNSENNSTSNDVVFVGVARQIKKRITELSLLEVNKEEYVTRHLVDGRIIYCDHRISIVAGYMTQEVSGMSAFAYIHEDDVMWTIMGLRQMYDRGEGNAESCYRLKTKTGEYIYLHTHAFIELDKATQSFQSFVCVNSYVSTTEGERLVNEMKTRYSATVTDRAALFPADDSTASSSDPHRTSPKVCVKDPAQLEYAISNLVSDLSSPAGSDDRLSPSPLPADTQVVKAALISQRLPPAAIHANQVGISKFPSITKDKYQTMQSETANHGSPASTHSQQLDDCSDAEESRHQRQVHLSSSKRTGTGSSNFRTGDKVSPVLVSTSASRQIILPPRDPKTSEKPLFVSETLVSVRHVSRGKDLSALKITSRASSISDDDTSIRDTKMECMASSPPQTAVIHRGKPDNLLAYVKTENAESVVNDCTGQQSSYAVKRLHPDDNPSLSNKRRRTDQRELHSQSGIENIEDIDPTSTYYATGGQSSFICYPEVEGLNPAAVHCKVEELQSSSFSNGLASTHDTTDSPISSLHDLGVDYQHIHPSNLELAGYGEHLVDFPDLQGEPLLSPGSLDANPDLMTMFDDLRPVIGFKKTMDDRRLRQLSNDDQAVSEELKRTHIQLENSMILQESQLCVIERDLENPMLQAQLCKPRERLIELRAEQKKNTRMLKTIQQDHHNMQGIVKQNIGA